MLFQVGQNALEVSQAIIHSYPYVQEVLLISHEVEINWRQKYLSSTEKLHNLIAGLEHQTPNQIKQYSRQDFLKLKLNTLPVLPDREVWSIASLVTCMDGSKKHIAMMNFHPEDIALEDVKRVIEAICPNREGVLLESGRYYHYYGNYLLESNAWVKFMAQFLMPCVVVSPRYVGHRLYDGYATLHLTTNPAHKPAAPTVIGLLK